MNKYKELDNQIESLRFHFFDGIQGDGPIICGTCKHFESILDDSGSVLFLGHCNVKCNISNGNDKVHAETVAIQDGRESQYEPLLPLETNTEPMDDKIFVDVSGSELTISNDTKIEDLHNMRFYAGIKNGIRLARFELIDNDGYLVGHNDMPLSIDEIDSMISELQKLRKIKTKYGQL